MLLLSCSTRLPQTAFQQTTSLPAQGCPPQWSGPFYIKYRFRKCPPCLPMVLAYRHIFSTEATSSLTCVRLTQPCNSTSSSRKLILKTVQTPPVSYTSGIKSVESSKQILFFLALIPCWTSFFYPKRYNPSTPIYLSSLTLGR